MALTRYIMIGGFLGAGKTTAMLKLAAHLRARGQNVALITNDQSVNLVDTARVQAGGYRVQEITGGCFCCRFDALVNASRTLMDESNPDVIIAEPVGSCTDLKATVSYPLRKLHGGEYRVAPLSVMVDPARAAAALRIDGQSSFTELVDYIYLKQLEEAEIIVINKIDLLDAAARERLCETLARNYPAAKVMEVSCVSGEGLEAWFERLMQGDLGAAAAMEVDYDDYADGEARLGWVNVLATLRSDGPFDADEALANLLTDLQESLREAGAEIGHLKMTLRAAGSRGGEAATPLASVSVSRSGGEIGMTSIGARKIAAGTVGELFVNLRAEADPALLKRIVQEGLQSMGVKAKVEQSEAFRPGRPTPTHRMATA